MASTSAIFLASLVWMCVHANKRGKIMTFNLRVGSAWASQRDGRHIWGNRARLVAATIREEKTMLVVGTQEGLKHQIEFLANELDFGWVGRGRIGDDSDDDEYSALIYNRTRVNVIDQGTFWLSKSPSTTATKDWGAALPRIASWAAFRFVAQESPSFCVISTHFDHESRRARDYSSLLIRAYVEALERRFQVPVLVLGDFNMPKDSETMWDLLTATDENLSRVLERSEVLIDDLRFPEDTSLHDFALGVGRGLVDVWEAIPEGQRDCGLCGQSTYHAFEGSAVRNHHWTEVSSAEEHHQVAKAGRQHIDWILHGRELGSTMKVLSCRMLTEAALNTDAAVSSTAEFEVSASGDGMAKNSEIFPSDHYPLVTDISFT
jgi:endonuclease/exonuclease/phosphatase family metal-dependent hydrolase